MRQVRCQIYFDDGIGLAIEYFSLRNTILNRTLINDGYKQMFLV